MQNTVKYMKTIKYETNLLIISCFCGFEDLNLLNRWIKSTVPKFHFFLLTFPFICDTKAPSVPTFRIVRFIEVLIRFKILAISIRILYTFLYTSSKLDKLLITKDERCRGILLKSYYYHTTVGIKNTYYLTPLARVNRYSSIWGILGSSFASSNLE